MTAVVALGIVVAGAVGTTLRVIATDLDAEFNRQLIGTLVVNIAGSFLLGVLVSSEADAAVIVGVGGLGSLTTFSTYISQIECIGREASIGRAVAYGAGSLIAGVGAAAIGWSI